MNSKNLKYVLATAILSAGFANAEPEISYKLIHESAAFSDDGALIGATSTNAFLIQQPKSTVAVMPLNLSQLSKFIWMEK